MCVSTEKKRTRFVEGGDAGSDREDRITRFIRKMNYGVAHGMSVIWSVNKKLQHAKISK